MAKQIRYIRLTLANGDTKVTRVKTTTEKYIKKLISDLILPAKVIDWELI